MIFIKKDGVEVNLELGVETLKGILIENKKNNIQREIPYILPKKIEYSPNRYTVFIFFHNECPENYIFQVYEKNINQRIGWIFPIQAILSNSHSYADDEHFLKIAYPAFINLIYSKNIQPHNIPLLKENLTLEDFYSINSVILILDNKELKKINNFKIRDYIPNLYQYGYSSKKNKIKSNKNIWNEFLEDINSNKIRKRITISSISKKLKDDDFIFYLFEEALSKEEHPVIRFYLLYQIIELLIRKVFNDQFKKKISFIKLEEEDLFDLNKKLQEMTNEKRRINLLFNKYTQISSPELEGLFLDFLNIKEKDEKTSLADLLYSVRTFLVHNYRQVTIQQKNLIGDINFYFERIVIYLLINYNEK